ncbi:MAG: putative capsid assembly scaffolding protein [Prokaryotic dsDNA virus sp.]|nr:MAG: putative capsid assembly scaffolding protein [Prokaryotic dsDNA virus sp.]|tara:strand:- start:27574 stop:28359 length:786 start_codon:yes stop_codon:yes gene_type:complete
MAEQVDIQDSNPPAEGAAEARLPSEIHNEARPDWLPEKFKSAEQMAEAYSALESKMGAGAQEAEKAAPEPAPAEPAVEVDGLEIPKTEEAPASQDDFLVKYENEFAEAGKLSDGSYEELAKQGLSRRHVDAYIAGIQATAQAEEARVYEAVGGQDTFVQMAQWAAENMPEGEVARINEMFSAGGNDAVLAARALQAAYSGSGMAQPNMVQADSMPGGSTATYESYRQLMTDMGAPEYQSDPAFRKKVEEKLMRTRQNGVQL